MMMDPAISSRTVDPAQAIIIRHHCINELATRFAHRRDQHKYRPAKMMLRAASAP
jgi:hypothetical protein